MSIYSLCPRAVHVTFWFRFYVGDHPYRCILKILWIILTNCYWALTFSRPRRPNRLNPMASVIYPNAGSTVPSR